MSVDQIANKISDLLDFKLDKHSSIESDVFTIDFFNNKEFNENKAIEFPDGFIHFPHFLDIDIVDEEREREYKEVVRKIMLYLWSEGCQLVASSDFEDELPHNGGYKQSINYD